MKNDTGKGGGKPGGKPNKGRYNTKSPGTVQPTRVGACEKLVGHHVFDYGSKDATDLLETTWEAIKTYVGTHFNEDIKLELETGIETVIPEPTLPKELIEAHEKQWELQKARLERTIQ